MTFVLAVCVPSPSLLMPHLSSLVAMMESLHASSGSKFMNTLLEHKWGIKIQNILIETVL